MTWVNQDKCAIVGIGATDYYMRGKSWPRTINDMAGEAILNACADAGISVRDIDGIAYYSTAGAGYLDKFDTASLMETLGIPYVGFSATLTSGGGGCPGAIGLAAAGLMNGDCKYTITLMALQQLPQHRLGVVFGASKPTPENSFLQPSGLVGPGHLMSVLARRHMHLYGTKPEAFREIVMATRDNTHNRPKAIRKTPLSQEEYDNSPMLADPLRRLDFCLETDGAVAVVTTTIDRAKDCRHPPAVVHGVAHGGTRQWGRAFAWMGMPDPDFASSGHKFVADRIWDQTGLTAADMDVALIYDHFSAMVLMQLEDYGFCGKGEGSDYVLSGKLRYDLATGSNLAGGCPVNTHGGNLNEAYIIGMTHIVEGVEQVRGTAINQVKDAEFALVTGGPASAAGIGHDPEESSMIYGPARALPGTDIHITTNPDTEPFWEAAKDHRLTACQCADCGHFRMPPSPYCPECQSRNKAWPTLPGTATVFSFAICSHDPKSGAPYVYVPIVVDIDGAPGARLNANVSGCDAEDVHIGMKVTVDWTTIEDGWVLPNFKKV